MGAPAVAGGVAAVIGAAYLFWRRVWFFRNPRRVPPPGDGLLSPADGTVVYARALDPEEEVVSVKRGRAARVRDIAREDFPGPLILIGVFMSPFDVHHNRAPMSGEIVRITRHPPVFRNRRMGRMHLRTLLGLVPRALGSPHLVENERAVTLIRGRWRGRECPCHVIQIAGWSVAGIEHRVAVGARVGRGEVFGMIRIGSQVDMVVPKLPGMRLRVREGERVRAGETVVVS